MQSRAEQHLNAAAGAPCAVALVGSVGMPARYGGFETFVQELAPRLAMLGMQVTVTCDATQYETHPREFRGCRLLWLPLRANGVLSVLHDSLALLLTCWRVDVIVILGVSSGPMIPVIRAISRARLIVNTDGVEWRRGKFNAAKQMILRLFDRLAQVGSHTVVIDNEALAPFVLASKSRTAAVIAYGGDHALATEPAPLQPELVGAPYALTICRIEPENNVGLLIEAFLQSSCERYVFVGNWSSSDYGRGLYERYRHEPRLKLLQPIYDAAVLRGIRQHSRAYLHGHSVGGTNPSLVEMLFFDAPILAFDCEFNRATCGRAALYFGSASSLRQELERVWREPGVDAVAREGARSRYTWAGIAREYASLLRAG